MAEEAELEEGGKIRRRRMRRPLLLATASVVAAALLVVWTQRRPIASSYIERELTRRGVQASYKVDHVGFNRERLVDVVIGDPARPDLVARSVEVGLAWSFGGPKVTLIRARGVRLHGRLVDGKLKLGQVDRLLPPPSGAPFRLPDQNVDLADAGLRLETPWGRIGIGVEGRGKLSDGFKGRLALRASSIEPAGCRVEQLAASWAVAVDALRPHLAGPVSVNRIACGTSFAAGTSRADLDATLEPALDGWRGDARLEAAKLAVSGNRLARLGGDVSFAGNSGEMRGRLALAGKDFSGSGAGAAEATVEGPWSLSGDRLTLAGSLSGKGVVLADSSLAPVRSALAGLGGTPIGPIAAEWSQALTRAARSGSAVAAGIHLAREAGTTALRIDRLDVRAASGAQLALSAGDGVTLRPGTAAAIDGLLTLAGGGLPEARFRLRRAPDGGLAGTGTIAPVHARGARLALGEIRFGAAGGETRIETVATIDGPFSGGRVAGLVVPIRARIERGGGFAIGERCTPVAFRSLQTGTLRLGPTRLPLCPTGRALVWQGKGGIAGGASVAGLRLAGSLGSSPLSVAADRFRFALGDSRFAASGVKVRLGPADAVNRLDISALDGRSSGRGLSGSFAGLDGQLAAVRLRVGEGKGEWRLAGTDLAMNGAITVSDDIQPPRIHPLVSRDFRLTLHDNKLVAGGALRDPKTATHVADVTIRHDLATGAGRASLDVPGIRFDPAYQPEQLTPLTVGVVALVDGVLKGQGEIAWDSAGTRSSGTFSTENMNLAASFGPVEGLSTTIHFTDLLGLVTAPGQVATTRAIHAGVDVFDGRVRYEVLPELKVRVEEGLWPFAGGELRLEDTILDFGKPTTKRLTFHVAGMDIARFVQQMEFSNIAATGTVDGLVPMIFDERGGRVEGGHLVARDGGGTISYVGELTDRDLGAYGKLAFDALKSLRYSRLVVDLNGSLEGEFVAGIQLDGIARDVAAAPAQKGGISAMVVGRVMSQLAKIPFKFNIQARGPFRALIGTARSFEDPTNLIQSVLPEMLRGKPTSTTVQPKESEPVR